MSNITGFGSWDLDFFFSYDADTNSTDSNVFLAELSKDHMTDRF